MVFGSVKEEIKAQEMICACLRRMLSENERIKGREEICSYLRRKLSEEEAVLVDLIQADQDVCAADLAEWPSV